MRWLRALWAEIVFVALFLALGGVLLGASPRLESETASLALLFSSHLAFLISLTFLVLRSTLTGWWLAIFGAAASVGVRAVASGWEQVLLGASPAKVARGLAVDGVLMAAAVVLVMVFTTSWQNAKAQVRWAELGGMLPVGGALAVGYGLAYTLVGVALVKVGDLDRPAAALGVERLLVSGLGRGVVMLACITPLVVTLAGRRGKNAAGVGVFLALAGAVVPQLAAAHKLSGVAILSTVIQGVLAFFLGWGLVRFTRPPFVVATSSTRQPRVILEEGQETPAPPEEEQVLTGGPPAPKGGESSISG